MIIDVQKYLFIGVDDDLNLFFERAQKEGCIEFISPTGKRPIDFPDFIQDLLQSIKILRKQPTIKKFHLEENLNVPSIVSHVIELKSRLESLSENKRIHKAEISRISPFGHFSLEAVEEIKKKTGKRVQFFCCKTAKSHLQELPEELIYLTTEYDLDYFISISQSVVAFPGMIEMRIEKNLSDLETEQWEIIAEMHSVEEELKSHVIYLELLQETLVEKYNKYFLKFAKEELSYHFDKSLFAVEAWIPKNKLSRIAKLSTGLAIHAEEITPDKAECIPTYMENKSLNKVGEDLVHIYDTPAIKDRDPSGWVLWGFIVFFSMIISDAGYGLIYLAIALFLKFKFKQVKSSIRRLIHLFLLLSTGCVIWGVFTASYFGLQLEPSNPVNKVSFLYYLAEKKASYHMGKKDDVYQYWISQIPKLASLTSPAEFLQQGTMMKEGKLKYEIVDEFYDNILIEISLIMGIVHICLSLLRYLPSNWSGVGWLGFIIGGYFFFPYLLHATSIVNFCGIISKGAAEEVGLQLLIGGVVVACLLALIQHRMHGLHEIAKSIQIFADVLSYLRLYALGLAAMIMANTFNDLGLSVGFAAGFFILLIGHGVNMLIGIMAGVIHGLRLNFIEWYHYSFEGGGKIFKPLKILKVR